VEVHGGSEGEAPLILNLGARRWCVCVWSGSLPESFASVEKSHGSLTV